MHSPGCIGQVSQTQSLEYVSIVRGKEERAPYQGLGVSDEPSIRVIKTINNLVKKNNRY